MVKAGDLKVAAPSRDRLGESVMWHVEEQALYWIDLLNPTVRRMKGGKGEPESWTIPDTGVLGSLTFASGGRLMLAIDEGLVLFDPNTGRHEHFCDPNEQRVEMLYNDSKIDRDGRLWIGNCDKPEKEPRGVFYSVERDGSYHLADAGFAVANGPAFSPDGDTLYFSDSVGRRVFAYTIDRGNGHLKDRRLFATIENAGMPDGITTDAAGRLWVAHYGGGRVTRYTPEGKIDTVIPVPVPNVTCVGFGGSKLTTLYITTAENPSAPVPLDGALFSIEVDGPGSPEPIFQPTERR